MLGWSSQPDVDCFNSYTEPIARVPKWLQETVAEKERHALKKSKGKLTHNINHVLVKTIGD